ncbi:dTMP kinase [Candidatus Dependentiae bacterium]|nr:dTMP kinase [Candidatus Dependentiae bacterium]
MNKKGLLISVEGIDGSGKSLFSKNLYHTLKNKNDVILTKEPGGTKLGQKLRQILHEEKENVCDLSEFLLFASDRAQHFQEIIIPNLNSNKIIISDRMADSSLAYQGYGRKLNISMIKKVNEWAMQNIIPDITFYLEIDIKTALNRIIKRQETLTSFEKEKMKFWQHVLDGFDQIFKNRKDVIRLDATKNPDEILNQALTHLKNYI